MKYAVEGLILLFNLASAVIAKDLAKGIRTRVRLVKPIKKMSIALKGIKELFPASETIQNIVNDFIMHVDVGKERVSGGSISNSLLQNIIIEWDERMLKLEKHCLDFSK